MNLNLIKRTTLAVMLGSVLSACSTITALDEVVEDNTKKYQRAETMPPLAIPAGLSGQRINDDIVGGQSSEIYSEYEETAANPLAEKYDVEPETKPVLIGDGVERHLVITGDRDEIWQDLLGFWQQQDIKVRRKDARIGLMDTEADIEDGYAYRARMERGDDDSKVEIYITASGFENNDIRNEATIRQLAEYLGELHQGEAQQVVTAKPVKAKPQRKARPRPQARPEAEKPIAEVVYSGNGIEAVLIDEARGHYALLLDQNFAEAWRNIGWVLDSKQFTIEDRERSRGVFYIHYVDPFLKADRNEGFMDKLAFWQSNEDVAPHEYFYIQLLEVEDETKIIIKDIDQVRTSSETARRILSLIQEKLVN